MKKTGGSRRTGTSTERPAAAAGAVLEMRAVLGPALRTAPQHRTLRQRGILRLPDCSVGGADLPTRIPPGLFPDAVEVLRGPDEQLAAGDRDRRQRPVVV